jgi:hypothetical protein
MARKSSDGDGYTFDWNGNDVGGVSFELGTNEPPGVTRIDNLQISTIPEPSIGLLSALAGILCAARRRRTS